MAQDYFNLQQAAQALGISQDELKHLAQKKEIRSFQDRGTLRFRMQDVQELGRRRGTGASEPDLVLRENFPPKSGAKAPAPGPKSPAPKSPRTPTKPAGPDVFDFSLDVGENVDIGKEILSGSSKRPASGPKGSTRSPSPKPGSDSDVRLVGAAEAVDQDSNVRLAGPDSDVRLINPASKTPKVKKTGTASSPTPKKSSPSVLAPDSGSKKRTPQPTDSGARLVPMESDSDVKIVGAGSDEVSLGEAPIPSASDSDIRLEKYPQALPESGEGELPLTEEINLDEEIRKQEAALEQPQAKLKRKSKLKIAPSSPFELSDANLSAAPPRSDATPKQKALGESSDFELAPLRDDSSDFDLTPANDGSVLLQPDASADFSLELPDESALGGEQVALSGPSSGISLGNPRDTGISLEGGSSEEDMDLDLSLEVESTPKPVQSPADSDSEFELTLDSGDTGGSKSPAESDSEFELTLDDSGVGALQAEDSVTSELKGGSEEKDIFETDFEVPALEEDSGSGSQVVAPLEPDLESSDFDVALDESIVEDESASQVVALEEEADDSSETRAGEESLEADESGFASLETEGEVEVDGEEAVVDVEEDVDGARSVTRTVAAEPAPWGALPVVFMLPCVIVMVLVSLMGLELVGSLGGYKSPGLLTKAVSDLIGQKIK